MANKIQSYDFYMDISPYKVDGTDDEFNSLSVTVSYDSRRKHFYASLKAGWVSDFGFGCVILGDDNPLTACKFVIIKESPKNSQKTIGEMGAALELAKEGIRLYFDRRMWANLYNFVKGVALNGYTPYYQGMVANLKKPVESTEENPVLKQYSELKEKHPDTLLLFRCGDFYEAYEADAKACVKILGTALSKEKGNGHPFDMVGFPKYALDAYLPRLVRAGMRVAICDQTEDVKKITNNINEEDKTMTKSVSFNETKNVQNAQVNNNITTDADVAEVDDIMPQVTPKAKSNDKPGVTVPLSEHGTMVVGGCGLTPKTEKARPQTSAKVQDSVPATAKLTYATYEKKKTNKTTGKEYTVTHAKIMGFAETDEAYQRGVELHGAVSGEMVDGVKVLGLYFSHRYAVAAKDVCKALNEGKPFADCVAIIDNATEENARKREEWKQKLTERKQKREERKAAKNKPSAVSRQTSGEKSYTLDEVAAMLGKLLPAGAASNEEIKKILEAA